MKPLFSNRFWGATMVALLLFALITGCGGGDRESQLIGVWEVREGAASVEAPKALENADAPGGIAAAMATLAHSELDLKDDKTFSMSGAMTAQGSWAFDAEIGTLTLTPAGGAAPIAASLSDSNQQLSLPNPTGAGQPVVLQKK